MPEPGEFVTGNQMSGEIMAVLHKWGVPKHLISLDLHIGTDEAVTIKCEFYPTVPDDGGGETIDVLNRVTQTYKLVPVEP